MFDGRRKKKAEIQTWGGGSPTELPGPFFHSLLEEMKNCSMAMGGEDASLFPAILWLCVPFYLNRPHPKHEVNREPVSPNSERGHFYPLNPFPCLSRGQLSALRGGWL